MAATMKTHVGLVRRQNEDAAWFEESKGIFAVADGMGGHLAGEVASEMAIAAVREMADTAQQPGVAPLKEMVASAHERIAHHARENPHCAGMGTTLSALWFAGRYAYIAHVGDSRIYRLRDGAFDQITQDHSLVEELVRAGIITREQARVHPRRNVITRAIGTHGENAPDLLAVDVRPGDVYLLCSDGLCTMVEDDEIKKIISVNPLEEAAQRLVQAALDGGGKDNVTIILYRCKEG